MRISELIEEIQECAEWLETTEGDEVESISVENLAGILSRYLGQKIILTQD